MTASISSCWQQQPRRRRQCWIIVLLLIVINLVLIINIRHTARSEKNNEFVLLAIEQDDDNNIISIEDEQSYQQNKKNRKKEEREDNDNNEKEEEQTIIIDKRPYLRDRSFPNNNTNTANTLENDDEIQEELYPADTSATSKINQEEGTEEEEEEEHADDDADSSKTINGSNIFVRPSSTTTATAAAATSPNNNNNNNDNGEINTDNIREDDDSNNFNHNKDINKDQDTHNIFVHTTSTTTTSSSSFTTTQEENEGASTASINDDNHISPISAVPTVSTTTLVAASELAETDEDTNPDTASSRDSSVLSSYDYTYPATSESVLTYRQQPGYFNPALLLRPPRGYFNYDASAQALYGPGYPIIDFNPHAKQLVLEYTNNHWTDHFYPPPMVPVSEAIALTNNMNSNNSNSKSNKMNHPYQYYYWDEFGPDGKGGFGPWKETLSTRNMRHGDNNNNQCGNVGQQSPIDVRMSGHACVETHQIRTRPGDFRINFNRTTTDATTSNNNIHQLNNVQLQILPSKLRIWFQRRPCPWIHNVVCAEPDPPHADFPHGWGGFADTVHVDFKFPAEHRINGQQYEGEMQIYHVHPGRKRLPVISVLMHVPDEEEHQREEQTAKDNGVHYRRHADIRGSHPQHQYQLQRYDNNTGHNEYMQRAIDAFQYEYDTNMADCANPGIHNRLRRRRGQSALKFGDGKQGIHKRGDDINGETNGAEEEATITNRRHKDGEKQEDRNGLRRRRRIRTLEQEEYKPQPKPPKPIKWSPYHESLITTEYFYGYDGSLTEPPCTEIVSWFVMDEPMTISSYQLEQMKHILFTNVVGGSNNKGDTDDDDDDDDNTLSCETTSVHYQNSVARPIQETSDRQVWHCTRDNFPPDNEREYNSRTQHGY